MLVAVPIAGRAGDGHGGSSGHGHDGSHGHDDDDGGCTPTPTATLTPTPTPTATPAPAGGDTVWKDANGTAVPGAFGGPSILTPAGSVLPMTVYYADSLGYVWTLTTSYLQIQPVMNLNVLFESSDCSGAGYVSGPPTPRFTFQIPGEGTFRTYNDDASMVDVSVHSLLDASGCEFDPQGATLVVPLSQTVAGIQLPVLTLRAPLHPERPH